MVNAKGLKDLTLLLMVYGLIFHVIHYRMHTH